jgi:hypothetical protein
MTSVPGREDELPQHLNFDMVRCCRLGGLDDHQTAACIKKALFSEGFFRLPDAEFLIETRVGGSYEMPDGRKFWVDGPVAREIARRAAGASS